MEYRKRREVERGRREECVKVKVNGKPYFALSRQARRASKGFSQTEKKEVMRDEAMFEMWSSVSGGQAGAAAPDGGSGPQSGKPEGEETVNRRSDIGYGISEVAGGGRWKAGEMKIKKALLRSVSTGSQSFEGFPQRGKEVQR